MYIHHLAIWTKDLERLKSFYETYFEAKMGDKYTQTARLANAGCPLVDGPRRTGDCYYESLVVDPEGNLVEITI